MREAAMLVETARGIDSMSQLLIALEKPGITLAFRFIIARTPISATLREVMENDFMNPVFS